MDTTSSKESTIIRTGKVTEVEDLSTYITQKVPNPKGKREKNRGYE